MSVIWSGVTEEGAVVPVQVTAEGKVVAVGDGPEGDYLKLTGGNLTGDLTIDTDKIALNAADGSATFSGDVTTKGVQSGLTSNGTVGGQGFFLSGIGGNTLVSRIRKNTTGSTPVLIVDSKDTPDAISLNANGSATFSGDIIAGNNPTTGQTGARVGGKSGQLIACTSAPGVAIGVFKVGSTDRTADIKSDGSASFAGDKCGFTSAGELFFSSRGTRYKLFVSQGVCQAEEYTREMELQEKADQFIADKRETKKPSDPQVEVTTDNDNA